MHNVKIYIINNNNNNQLYLTKGNTGQYFNWIASGPNI